MGTEPDAPDCWDWTFLSRQVREFTDHDLTTTAADILLALMASASTDKVRPKDWWDRGQAALVAAAERSTSWPAFVSTACRKLQIETLRERSVSSLSTWGERMRDRADFARFSRFTARNAHYIVAVARQERERRRTEETAR